MKHARKMVLVDINKVKEKPAETISNAINTLISANEFNRTNFGSNALAVSYLDREMKEILDNPNLRPIERVNQYNQLLQKYLFLLRESEGLAPSPSVYVTSEEYVPSTSVSERSISPEQPKETTPFNPFTPVVEAGPSTSSSVKGHRINLPRTTPKEDRLRQERRKNSRYKDFFVNWGGLDRLEAEE